MHRQTGPIGRTQIDINFMKMQLKISKSKAMLAKEFCEYLVQLIHRKETFSIALSGGSTPKVIFDELATNFADKINWDKVKLFWGDERCVLPTNAESNYKMTLDHLISKIEIPRKNVHRIKGEHDPEKEAKRYARILEKELTKIDGISQFDLVILGMGDDGHTVSIFPDQIKLWDSKKLCITAVHPVSGQKRITITGKMINNAKAVNFLVTGENKALIVKEIVKKVGEYKSYPASMVQPTSGNLLWFLDAEAASGIS